MAVNAQYLTPQDDVPVCFRYLYIGTTGHVNVITENGDTVQFKNHPVGYLWCSVIEVRESGTSASDIVGLS